MRALFLVALLLISRTVRSQTRDVETPAGTESAAPDSSSTAIDSNAAGSRLRMLAAAPFARFANDQKLFWTMTTSLKKGDVPWMTMLGGGTAALFASDRWTEKQVPDALIPRSRKISADATYTLGAAIAGSFIIGKLQRQDHLSETGLLAGEAGVNALAASQALKLATERERPSQPGLGNRYGSFPSSHAAFAWAAASVLAHEYSGPLSRALAYGLASTVTVTRLTSKEHFASDAVVGSAIGWYFGREVYLEHHDRELGGASWRGSETEPSEGSRLLAGIGSSYVPIDSWVYGAFDQLIGAGLVSDAYVGVRPWTRMECARLLEGAEESLEGSPANISVREQDLITALEQEFRPGSQFVERTQKFHASVDSIYVRETTIAGTPLVDGFHFGQTIVNDYGRPYAEDLSAVSGFTAYAGAGPLAFFVRGEFQHSPALASEMPSTLANAANVDGTLPFSNARAGLNRFELLESTVGYAIRNVMLTFGRQSLWLGPEQSGPLLFSDNAAPMLMLRLASASPYRVPFLSSVLGNAQSEFFLGRLSGQTWEYSPQLYGPGLHSQPFLHGTKVSFHPTRNLEFGMGFTAQFGGPGNPFTWSNFLRTFYSHRVGVGRNPGKRLSQFDFSYRVPGLRNWLQAYCDLMVIDEYSPIGSTRPAMVSGLYFSRLPKLQKLELRMEGATTDLNVPPHYGPGAFYWDDRYRSGYTNEGNLIGSWIGRRGRGEQTWLTYHIAARDALQLDYRHNNVDRGFLAGGNLHDLGMQGAIKIDARLQFVARVQHERWHFPMLSPAAKSNVMSSVELRFTPKLSQP